MKEGNGAAGRSPCFRAVGAARLSALALSLVIGVVTLLAADQLGDERIVERVNSALDIQALALREHEEPGGADISISLSDPPRALVGEALYTAHVAMATDDDAQARAMLHPARLALASALRSRPGWGEAWTVMAFIDQRRKGAASAAALDELAHSYEGAPFLRDAAAWRIQLAFARWNDLGPRMKALVIEEAVWLMRTDARTTDALFREARGSAFYKPLMLRWYALRAADRQRAAREMMSPDQSGQK